MIKFTRIEKDRKYWVTKDDEGLTFIHAFDNPYDRKTLYWIDTEEGRKIFNYLKEAKQYCIEKYS